MATWTIEDETLTNIADAVREKSGTSGAIPVTQLAQAIENIPSGGSTLGTKNITANGTYNASSDNLDGYSQVTVNVSGSPVLQSKTATQNGTVLPDAGYDGLSSVLVNVAGGGSLPSNVKSGTFTISATAASQTINHGGNTVPKYLFWLPVTPLDEIQAQYTIGGFFETTDSIKCAIVNTISGALQTNVSYATIANVTSTTFDVIQRDSSYPIKADTYIFFAWFKDTPEPPVPQTGTWQLKTTTGKKYIIIGTDDDNTGNAKFFRLLRTYGFPYTMNTEAESMDVEYGDGTHGPARLGNDDDSTIFDENDAPSLFPESSYPNGVNVLELGQYLKTSGLGEVAQHGASSKALWDSSLLTGSDFDETYTTYTNGGGQKTQEELKTAIMEAKADTDVVQGASYVLASRATLQNTYNFSINTVGIWGGSPSVTIDGVSLDLNAFKSWTNYPWRTNNYRAASTKLGNGVHNNTTPYNISRTTNNNADTNIVWLDQIPYGHAHEFFWHQPLGDIGNTKLRQFFNAIAALVTAGKAEVVTRAQYEAMGEYVQNPVVSITATRADITLGDPDSKNEYHVTATYADNTTADVSSEAVVWNDAVDTSTVGTYTVPITYRGANITISVVVTDGSSSSVDLHFVYTGHVNANNGVYGPGSKWDTYCASSSLIEYNSNKTYFVSYTGAYTNNKTYPRLSSIFCYTENAQDGDRDETNYLGEISISGLAEAGKWTEVELPDITQTYPTAKKFRIQGRVNASKSTEQTNGWSCHTDAIV